MKQNSESFPCLLYLADVPVESSYHGSALLHRLLGEWPAERLMLVEPGFAQSHPDRRLPNVSYRTLPYGIPRLLHSRLVDVYGSFVLATAKSRRAALGRKVADFKPEAVLTVTHGYSWITAAAFAAERGLPLHLICHDDWLLGLRVLPGMKLRARRWFGEYYRQAVSRLCVSPFMVEKYQSSFGVDGAVLYPSRAADCPECDQPPERIANNLARPSVAFAGTVNGPGYVRALVGMAGVLASFKGRLLIYGPMTQSQAEAVGLTHPNIEIRGLIKSDELIARLRAEADALYVPMSFAPQDRVNMEVGFPSKLTDYSAVGLPLLIHGPSYCSAVRWARDNPGVAEVVDSENGRELAEAVERVCRDGGLRWRLASNAIRVGRELFSHAKATRTFLNSFPRSMMQNQKLCSRTC